jgi:DNA replication and repair protein RecF
VDIRDEEVVEAQLLAAMQAQRPVEIERGMSLVGPHRDDFTLTLNDLPAKGYASHGETWSFALALKMGCYAVLGGQGLSTEVEDSSTDDVSAYVDNDASPVLILDDVFAELDVHRRDALAELIAPARQVLITAAVAQDVPENLRADVYTVHDGTVTHA